MYKAVVVSLFLIAQIGLAVASGSITGNYIDNFHVEIKLTQTGNRISGTASSRAAGGGNVVMEGTIENGVIELTIDPAYGSTGKGELNVEAGGVRLSGRVRKGGYRPGWSTWTLSKLDAYGQVMEAPPTIADSPSDGDSGDSVKKPPVSVADNWSDPDEMIPVGSGTGFAVSREGYIITNRHVIEGCDHVVLFDRGEAKEALILYSDSVNDLALLRADFSPGRIFSLSRRNPELMQDVFVAGYPFGNAVSTSVKVTKGIVSSLTGIGNNASNIQIDAALQPGNSGGPIFDNRGNVVAVAVAKLDLLHVIEKWGVVPENTNFGIKSNVVVNLLESNGIGIQEAKAEPLPNTELGAIMNGATFHLSCWMTRARAQKLANTEAQSGNAQQ